MDEILRADSLYHIYESNAEDGNVVALRGLSVSILEGEAVAVVGPSGSGKSTLLKCLGALMKPSAGSVELAGRRVTRLTGPELVSLAADCLVHIPGRQLAAPSERTEQRRPAAPPPGAPR